MTERKTVPDISKSTGAHQPQEGEVHDDSWKSPSKGERTTKPGENAAANADDPKVLQNGIADGS